MLIHRRILDFIVGVRRYILLKSGLGLAQILVTIAQAVFLGRLLSHLIDGRDLDAAGFDIAMILCAVLTRVMLAWANAVLGKWIAGRVKSRLRRRILSKLAELGPGGLSHRQSGKLGTSVVAGIDYLEGYLSLYIPQILVCLIGSGGLIAYVFAVRPVLGLIALSTALLALFCPILFLRVIGKASGDHWAAYEDLNAAFVESIQGMLTLKALNASRRVGDAVKARMADLVRKTMRSLRVNLAEVGIAGFSSSLGTAFTLGLAAYFTAEGSMSMSMLSVLLFLTSEIYRPIAALGNYFHAGFMGLTATDGIAEILDADPPVKNVGAGAFPKTGKPPELRLEDVRFAYPQTTSPVFELLSLTIRSGERLAVVGESGSGKSTLVSLLVRFYDPDAGTILLDGMPIQSVPLETLRGRVAVVSQDTYLFGGTIRDNLRLAKENATEKELMDACRAARIDDLIRELPDGLDAMLGERGMNLSGGQRQRLSIARALLKNADFIILDEATSSVDEENEREIQEILETRLRGKTCLIIAHRLSTIKSCDRILVMRAGQIVEQGTHESLIAKDGAYRRLVRAQNERKGEFA